MAQILDPMQGLAITPIIPAPSGPLPSVLATPTTQAAPAQPTPTPSIKPDSKVEKYPATGKKPSLLDSIIFAILGTPENNLAPEQIAKKQRSRKEAGSLAQSGANEPGEAFMGIPSGGGSSLAHTIGTILSVIR